MLTGCFVSAGCFISDESRPDGAGCTGPFEPRDTARCGAPDCQPAVRRPWQLLGLVIGLSVLAAGCDRGLTMGQVSGRVTFGGEPVTQGAVLFYPPQGPGAVGALDDDGNFTMKTNGKPGVIVGQNIVSITPPTDISIIGMPAYPGAPPNVTFDNIPEKFRLADSSGLEVEVEEGDNEFDFELEE